MALVSAVSVACLRVMTPNRALAYQTNIRQWLRDLEDIHGPVIGKRVNPHMAIHISQISSPLWPCSLLVDVSFRTFDWSDTEDSP